jgi:hypothetical protein
MMNTRTSRIFLAIDAWVSPLGIFDGSNGGVASVAISRITSESMAQSSSQKVFDKASDSCKKKSTVK